MHNVDLICEERGGPPQILAISGNILLRFIDTPVFNIIISLNITIVGVSYFIVVADLGYVTPPPPPLILLLQYQKFCFYPT